MSTSTSTNSNARGRATARSIEAAAVRLAAQHGAAALTVDQICEEAGVKQRTFFNHFRTKEDALLGSALPVVNERRAREYLSDGAVGVLSGALRLIDLPSDQEDVDGLSSLRMQVFAASPALAERQAGRLLPLAQEVREIVRLKLAALGPDESRERIEASATLITRIASALLLAPRLPGDDGPPLGDLEWVWGRLL